jgi:hypothetical protein
VAGAPVAVARRFVTPSDFFGNLAISIKAPPVRVPHHLYLCPL